MTDSPDFRAGQASRQQEIDTLKYELTALREERRLKLSDQLILAAEDFVHVDEVSRVVALKQATLDTLTQERDKLKADLEAVAELHKVALPDLTKLLRVFADLKTKLGEAEQARDRLRALGWQPMETMPEGGPFLVYWQRNSLDKAEIDMVGGRQEYEEIVGYGEPPATHWMPLPAPPAQEPA